MPPWFIDIESATEIEAKSKATPPASRTAAAASRASSPSSALHGVTRPSVEATPTKGFSRSASFRPSARRNARWGARSSPSTVTRDGRIGIVFFVFIHDFPDTRARAEAQRLGLFRQGFLGHRIHDLLQDGVGLEAHLPLRASLHRIPHLLRAHGNPGKEDRLLEA